MKSLVTNVIKKRSHQALNELIPVFVVLRNLAKKQQTVTQAIVSAFADHHFPGAENFVESSLEAGRMIVVLDGLDEVGANREFVVEQILNFCNHDAQRAHQNRLLVTCREHSYKTMDLHDGLREVLQVEPFTNHHMRVFLEGWPPHKGRTAIRLFALIQSDAQLRDICRNPLLLTILTGLYLDTDNFEIPSSRERFYQNAADELLIRRPARRQIRQQFNVEDKRQILERVSLERLETVGLNEDPEELTEAAIRVKAEDVLRTNKFDLHELLKELVDINGIIKPLQDNSYTCAHRTILEYFAAREALRSRETQKVVEIFGSRPELIEVLYFYCGLLKNLPALTNIIRTLISQRRWIEAGRSLLHMNEAPGADLVELVVSNLYREILDEGGGKESIELLSSLSNRRDSEFESARRYFSSAIDRLTANNHSGASSLEAAIATSPEIALNLIPGLLKHPSEPWRAVGVQLLRDIGVDEALDKLVQLLNDDDRYVRKAAGMVLAEMIRTRNQALRQRVVLLPERRDSSVWPLEAYFPGAVALPIAEAIVSGEASKSEAINQAVRAIKLKARGQDDAVFRKWRRIPIDIAFQRCRRLTAGVLILFGLLLTFTYVTAIVSFQTIGLLTNKVIVVSIASPKPKTFSRDLMEAVSSAATEITQEIEASYPLAVSGWARILPWNWFVDSSFPDSANEALAEVKTLKVGLFDPFEIGSKQALLKKLSSIDHPPNLQPLSRAIAALNAGLPPTNSSYLVFVNHWPPIAILGFGILATWSVFRSVRGRQMTLLKPSELFSVFFGKRPSHDLSEFFSPYYHEEPAITLNALVLSAVIILMLLNGMPGSSWMKFSLPLVGAGAIVVGLIVYVFNWPYNPFLAVVDEVDGGPPHISSTSSAK